MISGAGVSRASRKFDIISLSEEIIPQLPLILFLRLPIHASAQGQLSPPLKYHLAYVYSYSNIVSILAFRSYMPNPTLNAGRVARVSSSCKWRNFLALRVDLMPPCRSRCGCHMVLQTPCLLPQCCLLWRWGSCIRSHNALHTRRRGHFASNFVDSLLV